MVGSPQQSKGHDCIARLRRGIAGLGKLGEQLGFKRVGDGHLAGCDLGGCCALEAELAVAEGFGIGRGIGRGIRGDIGGGGLGFHTGFHANGRAKDAAGHGTPRVEIAMACGWVQRGTGSFVGKLLKALLIGFRCATQTGAWVAGKLRTVRGNPGFSSMVNFQCKGRVGDPERGHAGLQPQGVKRVDGKRAHAALGASGAADQPLAGAVGRFSQGRVHDLHEFGVGWGQLHPGKDTGLRAGTLPR